MNARRIISPPRRERSESMLLRCCAGGCRKLCAIANDGFLLPCCIAHALELPAKLYWQAARLAPFSAFDPLAVIDSMRLVLRVNAHFGLVPRRKRQRKAHS